MKRVGGLYAATVSRRNLLRAAYEAGRGKRDRAEVREFFDSLEDHIRVLGESLRSGRFEFGPYRTFEVSDTKKRTIHAPPFVDRVVHHAIIGVARSVFERGAIEHSYACRRGKGQHAAVAQAKRWTRRGGWYGKMDVRRFYDSVDHDLLCRMLARRFSETLFLELLYRVVDSYSSVHPQKGLPIGALTSQYLGNFYLDAFDRQMKTVGKVRRYVRYMDDIVVWGQRTDLASWRGIAVDSLGDLGLELKHGGEWNSCQQGVPFLGYVIYPDRVRVNRMGRKRLRGKLRANERRWESGAMSERELKDRGTALFAHACVADDVNWRREVTRWSRYERRQSEFGETLENSSGGSRRVLEQPGGQLPLGVSQQEPPGASQQQSGLSGLSVSRRGAAKAPDDASSRAQLEFDWAESTGKPSSAPYIQSTSFGEETGVDEAPTSSDAVS